nr:lipolytic protein [uncultured bacterium]
MAVAAALATVLGGLAVSSGPRAAAAADAPLTSTSTAGCGKAPTMTSGTRTILSSGQTRSYILRLPANYDPNRPHRLIFGFHWLGGTANDVDSGGADGYNWSYYGLRRLAESAGAATIFVAPQGNNNGWANPSGQDVTFVDDMLALFKAELCIDTSQIFSLGFSYGGAMSYALACARPAVFRAVAVYSGANLSGCNGGTQPVAYIGLHGTQDNVLPIASGRALRDTFVRNNRCTQQNPPEPPSGSLTHIVTAYSGCMPGYPVVWAAFDGGHNPAPIDGCNCSGWRTWTSGVVWDFFTQFQGSPPSTSTTSSTTTTTTAPGGACAASYRTVSSWPGGFQGEVRVTAGSAAISGWTVRWTLSSGQAITQVWNGTLRVSGSSVSVSNAPYNGSLPALASTTFGFLASGTPSTPTLTCTSP